MQHFIILVMAGIAVLLAGPAVAQPSNAAAGSPTIAVLAGRLIDPAQNTVLSHQVILVQGGKVVAVGSATSVMIPADAKRVDLSN